MNTGIPRIDELISGNGTRPIGATEADAEAIGVVQDLLIGHGYGKIPGVLVSSHGRFGPQTQAAVTHFQKVNGLPQTGAVNATTLKRMVELPAPRAVASRGYLALVLDTAWAGFPRLVSLTAQFEAAGCFTAINKNTDGAGLSFGLIQWAQKPGRLAELLRALSAAEEKRFVEIFGSGDAVLAKDLIAHTSKRRGGTGTAGVTTDPRFNLVAEPWISRFLTAGRDRSLQRVQLSQAVAAYRTSFERIRTFAPQVRNERAFAFMLDLANQHGDSGAESIFRVCARPQMPESALLEKMEAESVARVRAQFGDGPVVTSTRSRRKAFRRSPLLSDLPFSA